MPAPSSRSPAGWPYVPPLAVVGRSTELELLGSAVKRVAEAEGREVLLIAGEAGVGKTTLVAEVAQSAFDDGTCVLFGHCEEDLTAPYQLFAEALGHYVTYAPEDQLLAHVDAHGSEIARLVPALASRVPGLPPTTPTDADTERYLLFGAVVDLLASASHHQPIILAFDDLQWADKGSLLLLRHRGLDRPAHAPGRARHLPRQRVVLTPHALVDTLGALHRQSGVTRIDLTGLDDTGVVAVMEAAAGHRPRRSRSQAGPCHLPGDRRQPVLRDRGPPPPHRDGSHLPGRLGTLGGHRLPRGDRPARQCADGDRWPGRAPGPPRPSRCCHWPP